MVPTIEGEFARKRRMMVGLWDIVVGEGMLLAARLPAALRLRALLPPAAPLRDARSSTSSSSLANLVLLGERLVLLPDPARPAGAARRRGALAPRLPDDAAVRICRYYVLTQASIVLGLWDRLRHGPGGRWEKAAGTR